MDEGVCLQDELGKQVKKGKIETHTDNPLIFADSDELDLKNLKVQEFYNGRNVSWASKWRKSSVHIQCRWVTRRIDIGTRIGNRI